MICIVSLEDQGEFDIRSICRLAEVASSDGRLEVRAMMAAMQPGSVASFTSWRRTDGCGRLGVTATAPLGLSPEGGEGDAGDPEVELASAVEVTADVFSWRCTFARLVLDELVRRSAEDA